MKSMITLFFLVFLSACTATKNYAPTMLPSSTLERPTYDPVTPVYVPQAFEHDTINMEYQGKQYVLVHVDDVPKIMQAYVSAESNAGVVEELDKLNDLRVQQINILADVMELEELRSQKLKTYIRDEQELRDKQDQNAELELWFWKILAGAGLLIGVY
jgi:hypothetical protein